MTFIIISSDEHRSYRVSTEYPDTSITVDTDEQLIVAVLPSFERTGSVSDRHSGERWELDDVQALSTTEITDRLAEYGIDTTEESFRDRAA